MPVCLLCNKGFENRVIIDGKEKNLSSRKYCIKCSPFNIHNTQRITIPIELGYKVCCRCKNKLKLDNFYNKGKSKVSCCKKCFNKWVIQNDKEKKIKALNYLGGKCVECGFDKHYAALEFHHKDSNNKEFEWKKLKRKSWDIIKKELDKCEIRCSNCHKVFHAERK